MSAWISVKERLPEPGERVTILIVETRPVVSIACHIPEIPQWTTIDGCYYHGDKYAWVAYWQPLPEIVEDILLG